MRKRNALWRWLLILMIAATGVSAITTAKNAQEAWDSVKVDVLAEALFINPDDSKDVMVGFVLNGKEYIAVLPQVKRLYAVGEQMDIEVNPNNPENLWVDLAVKTWFGFGFVGLAVILGGCNFLVETGIVSIGKKGNNPNNSGDDRRRK